MKHDFADKVKELHRRLAGTKIRQQIVESVEVTLDTNGSDPDFPLRYFIIAHFKEPELPVNMRDELKLLRRVFWQTDFAQALLSRNQFAAILDGCDIPEDVWTLSDELMTG